MKMQIIESQKELIGFLKGVLKNTGFFDDYLTYAYEVTQRNIDGYVEISGRDTHSGKYISLKLNY